jgi:hypothetical protein
MLDQFLNKLGPLKLTEAEVRATKSSWSLGSSAKFQVDLVKNCKYGAGKTTFKGSYDDARGIATLTATLGQWTALIDADVECNCLRVNEDGTSDISWSAKGTFSVSDKYDFNVDPTALQDALDDYIKHKLPLTHSAKGKYQGRTIQGQIKTAIMARVQKATGGVPYDVTSDKIAFTQESWQAQAKW